MNDTPLKVRELQLKIWFDKKPSERLLKFIQDNDKLYKFWNDAKIKLKNANQ